MHVGRGLRRRGLGQAEHSPSGLVNPVPQMSYVAGRLDLQVGEASPGHVIHRHPAGDLMISMNSGTGGLLAVIGLSKRP